MKRLLDTLGCLVIGASMALMGGASAMLYSAMAVYAFPRILGISIIGIVDELFGWEDLGSIDLGINYLLLWGLVGLIAAVVGFDYGVRSWKRRH